MGWRRLGRPDGDLPGHVLTVTVQDRLAGGSDSDRLAERIAPGHLGRYGGLQDGEAGRGLGRNRSRRLRSLDPAGPQAAPPRIQTPVLCAFVCSTPYTPAFSARATRCGSVSRANWSANRSGSGPSSPRMTSRAWVASLPKRSPSDPVRRSPVGSFRRDSRRLAHRGFRPGWATSGLREVGAHQSRGRRAERRHGAWRNDRRVGPRLSERSALAAGR